MTYIAYLDEFGHIGPYISNDHEKYNTHPAFGLGGIVLPADKSREFSTFFFQLKSRLLSFEIEQSGVHSAKWEKKGSQLYTTKNVLKYQELRKATNRIINKIKNLGGYIFYVGQMKKFEQDSKKLYQYMLKEAIKRLDEECQSRNSNLIIIIDEQENSAKNKNSSMRSHIVEAAAISMFGEENRKSLIEPPIAAESHLYQNLQCADWICGLIGRMAHYQIEPNIKSDYEWVDKYFKDRIQQAQKRSSIREFPRKTTEDLQRRFNGTPC